MFWTWASLSSNSKVVLNIPANVIPSELTTLMLNSYIDSVLMVTLPKKLLILYPNC